MALTLRDLIGILIIYQSLVFGCSLILNKKSKPLFVKALLTFCGIIILHFGYMLLGEYLGGKRILLGPFFGLLYGPVYYVYSKSLILETSSLQKIRLHFIPALISLPFLIFWGNQQGALFDILGIAVTMHFITYLGITLSLLYKYRKELVNTISSFHDISLSWLEIIIYLQLGAIGVMLLESYFQSILNTKVLIIIIYFLVLILIHCFYYLGLKQVRLFKGFKNDKIEPLITGAYKIDEQLFQTYLNKLNTYMEQEKPYLVYQISLQDLSDQLSISPRNLSHVINKYYKKNFYDFINAYRLDEVKQQLKVSDKPIKEIMYDAGFSNRASFNSIFKRDTGMTPTQFRVKYKN